MDKPIVFISHITEEKEIALKFKELIESSFLGMLEVFVSSDASNISAGARWLDNITGSLKNCSIELILCSPKSVKRPWINFEAGAGWIRNIPVIPLCHSGMEPSQLPIPLNLLQAAKISDIPSLKLIFPVLAQAIGAKTPNLDFVDFVDFVTDFERKYTFWDECNNYFEKMYKFNPKLLEALKLMNKVIIDLTETQIGLFQTWMSDFFEKNGIMQFRRTGAVKIMSNGMFHECEVIPLSKLSNIVNDKYFKY